MDRAYPGRHAGVCGWSSTSLVIPFEVSARAVLVYIDAVEDAEAEEAEEARVQRDHGDQGGPSD